MKGNAKLYSPIVGISNAGNQIFDAIMQTNKQKKVCTVLTIQQMLSEIPRYLVPIGDGVEHHRLN